MTTSQQPPAGPPRQFPQHNDAPAGYGPPQVPAQWGPPSGQYPPAPTRKRTLLVGIAAALGAVGVVTAIAGGGPLAFLLGAIAFVCAVVGLARRARLEPAVAGVVLGAAAIVLSVVVPMAPATSPQPTASGTSTPTVPAAAQPTAAPAPPTVAPAPPAPAKAITARDWQKIAKNPDAHVGESVIVYGYVTQFDSGTGTDQFRASVDGVKHAQYYDYETNTLLSGDQSVLGDLVQDDVFKAEVVVGGSYTYSNTMGGSTTAPVLAVTKVTAIGTAG